jgi:hypothetical protein
MLRTVVQSTGAQQMPNKRKVIVTTSVQRIGTADVEVFEFDLIDADGVKLCTRTFTEWDEAANVVNCWLYAGVQVN